MHTEAREAEKSNNWADICMFKWSFHGNYPMFDLIMYYLLLFEWITGEDVFPNRFLLEKMI